MYKKHKERYDSSMNIGFVEHKPESTNSMFKPSKKGLFVTDVKQDVAHVLVNTVETFKINIQLKTTLMASKP